MRLFGRHPALDVVLRLPFDVVPNVLLELFQHALAPPHDLPSRSAGRKIRAIAPANLSHLLVSTASCRRPLAVNRWNFARRLFSEVPSSTAIHPRLISRCSPGYSDPCSTCNTSSELNSMALAMAWPCARPNSSVRRISRSKVPCSSSMRSFCSLVDILGDHTVLPVECQGEQLQLRG